MRFDIGDKVVYPNHGVGIIEDIRERDIAGAQHDFYHLRILANETVVMVPVGNSRQVGLRKIFGKPKVKKLFLHLRDADFEMQTNWKGRYKENAEKMRSGELFEMADVLKNLMHLAEKKALSYREKRMYEKAKYLIISEIAMVQGRAENLVQGEVETALSDCLQTRRSRPRKAAASN